MKIVFTWEWGAGWGHLRRFRPLAQRLVDAGHELVTVTRDLVRTQACLGDLAVQCLQSPIVSSAYENVIHAPSTIADIAWNLGYDAPERITATLRGWADSLRLLDPDLIIADFGLSSSAVAAAMQIPVIRLGTGYTCPPPTHPLAGLSGMEVDRASRQREETMIGSILAALRAVHLPCEMEWPDLLGQEDRTLLVTLPALDPYREARDNVEYLGVWDVAVRARPNWPSFGDCQTVAYLKPFPSLHKLLESLHRMGVSTALVGDAIASRNLPSFTVESYRIQQGPVDLEQAKRSCRFAICNANHGTTAKLMSLGIPILAIPLYLEQRLTAHSIQEKGLGIAVEPGRPESFHKAIAQLKHDRDICDRADRFANHCQPHVKGAIERTMAKLQSCLD